MVQLVRQADRDEGATRTLRAVDERRRRYGFGGAAPHCAEKLDGPASERGVEVDLDASARFHEVDLCARDNVPVLFENERLGADLDTLRLPRSFGQVRGLAALVVHRNDALPVDLN